MTGQVVHAAVTRSEYQISASFWAHLAPADAEALLRRAVGWLVVNVSLLGVDPHRATWYAVPIHDGKAYSVTVEGVPR